MDLDITTTEKTTDGEQEISTAVDMDQEKKEFECNVCAKKLSTQTGLKIHMRKHSGDTIFACEVIFKVIKYCFHLLFEIIFKAMAKYLKEYGRIF